MWNNTPFWNSTSIFYVRTIKFWNVKRRVEVRIIRLADLTDFISSMQSIQLGNDFSSWLLASCNLPTSQLNDWKILACCFPLGSVLFSSSRSPLRMRGYIFALTSPSLSVLSMDFGYRRSTFHLSRAHTLSLDWNLRKVIPQRFSLWATCCCTDTHSFRFRRDPWS